MGKAPQICTMSFPQPTMIFGFWNVSISFNFCMKNYLKGPFKMEKRSAPKIYVLFFTWFKLVWFNHKTFQFHYSIIKKHVFTALNCIILFFFFFFFFLEKKLVTNYTI